MSGMWGTKSLDSEDRCGIWPFSTDWFGEDEFHQACKLHDNLFVQNELGITSLTRLDADRVFLRKMLSVADMYEGAARWGLRTKAYVYYGLARAFGWIAW